MTDTTTQTPDPQPPTKTIDLAETSGTSPPSNELEAQRRKRQDDFGYRYRRDMTDNQERIVREAAAALLCAWCSVGVTHGDASPMANDVEYIMREFEDWAERELGITDFSDVDPLAGSEGRPFLCDWRGGVRK